MGQVGRTLIYGRTKGTGRPDFDFRADEWGRAAGLDYRADIEPGGRTLISGRTNGAGRPDLISGRTLNRAAGLCFPLGVGATFGECAQRFYIFNFSMMFHIFSFVFRPLALGVGESRPKSESARSRRVARAGRSDRAQRFHIFSFIVNQITLARS